MGRAVRSWTWRAQEGLLTGMEQAVRSWIWTVEEVLPTAMGQAARSSILKVEEVLPTAMGQAARSSILKVGLEVVWRVGHFSPEEVELPGRSLPVPSGVVSYSTYQEVEGRLHVTVVAVHACYHQVEVVGEVAGRVSLCLLHVNHEQQRIRWR